ncbi:ROK family protein [Novosphingobium sp. BL-52-GroH]|uniref:ROK family protein n=1 Tax=Novosphingobium sp. BL-52-GroH TaxID=3349877 RepID=UPI00384AB3EA
MTIFGAIEAGGTKFVCAVGSARAGSLCTTTIPTRDPESTFADVANFFRDAEGLGDLAGIGIASFGPVVLDPRSQDFGRILATPKPAWEGTDMIARVRAFSGVPLGLDTDVNAAALAEAWVAGGGVRQLAYVTVGTGIGVGLVCDGKTVHGIGHPEAGHILVRRHPAHADFGGICPFHGDCLEGLASGPAVAASWGISPSQFPAEHPFWEVEADYLAQLCMSLFLTVAPERIVLGGGVMKLERLLPMIQLRTLELLGNYVAGACDIETMKQRIVAPACTEPSGLTGAYLLAESGQA